jgi:hypothetical protein
MTLIAEKQYDATSTTRSGFSDFEITDSHLIGFVSPEVMAEDAPCILILDRLDLSFVSSKCLGW